MEPLTARLGATHPLDLEAMPLLDAIIHITMAIGGNVEPYALRLLTSCLAIAAAAAAADPASHPQATAQLTFALDACTALVEVLCGSAPALLAAAGAAAVVDMALAAVRHDDAAVQQSGLALVGELATHCTATVSARGGEVLAATFAVLQATSLDVRTCLSRVLCTDAHCIRGAAERRVLLRLPCCRARASPCAPACPSLPVFSCNGRMRSLSTRQRAEKLRNETNLVCRRRASTRSTTRRGLWGCWCRTFRRLSQPRSRCPPPSASSRCCRCAPLCLQFGFLDLLCFCWPEQERLIALLQVRATPLAV